jgi:hypothetical protein
MKKAGILGLSPYPWVDLKDPSCPNNGIHIAAPNFCKSHFGKGDACKNHYEKLSKTGVNNELVQCPYGFASQKAFIDGRNIAITSIIPWPRLGGKEEKLRSESKENHRISTEIYYKR